MGRRGDLIRALLVETPDITLPELKERLAQSGAQLSVAALCPSNITPACEMMRPPSKAAVIFLRPTAGNENGRRLSSIMAAVASMRWLKIHTLYQYLTLHPPAQNQALGE
jgi:hypothetical protein